MVNILGFLYEDKIVWIFVNGWIDFLEVKLYLDRFDWYEFYLVGVCDVVFFFN